MCPVFEIAVFQIKQLAVEYCNVQFWHARDITVCSIFQMHMPLEHCLKL